MSGDETTAIHAALHLGIVSGSPVFVTSGLHEVKAGFVNDNLRGNVSIRGGMRTTTDDDSVLGSIVNLNDPSQSSFFYSGTAGHHFEAKDVRFRAAQEVTGRKFWKSNVWSVNFRFTDVAFDRVEKPIVLESGSYSQMSSLTNVQFNDSGTIYTEHAETESSLSSLAGTLLTLNNVSHDGKTPENPDKRVMDLHGFRLVQATNLLLEGALPSAGWTVLKVGNRYNADWTRSPVGHFHGFFNEWTTNPPTTPVEQIGGRVRFDWCDLRLSASMKYKLTNSGVAHITDTAFVTTTENVNDQFDIEDSRSRVIIERSSLRRVDWSDERFDFRDCNMAVDGAVGSQGVASVVASNTQSAVVHKWDGGLADGDLMVLSGVGGTTVKLDTDTTYGRKYSVVPNANYIDVYYNVKPRGIVVQDTQIWVTATCRLPIFTSGVVTITPTETSAEVAGGRGFDVSYSGAVVTFTVPLRVRTTPSAIGMRMRGHSLLGVAGNLEIYALAVYMGNSAPRREFPNYPKNIITRASAAPTSGSWASGDVVWHTAPSAGGVPGWMCITSGSPGTWKAMANLAV